jgi:hypothetical protein
MQNYRNRKTVSPAKARKSAPMQLGAARQGYLDAIAGRGFLPAYETQGPKWQRAYEFGRFTGFYVARNAPRPYPWPATTALPRAIEAAMSSAWAADMPGTINRAAEENSLSEACKSY